MALTKLLGHRRDSFREHFPLLVLVPLTDLLHRNDTLNQSVHTAENIILNGSDVVRLEDLPHLQMLF